MKPISPRSRYRIFDRRPTLLLVVSGLAALAAAGCAGTSPQLTAPTLGAPNTSAPAATAAVGDPHAGAAAEAKLAPLEAVKTPADTFVAAPYLQIGAMASPGKTDTLTLRWLSPESASAASSEAWGVETRPAGTDTWKPAGGKLVSRKVAVGGVAPHLVWSVPLTGLTPGALFDYRITREGKAVFAARARARRSTQDTDYRFVVFGDCGAGTSAQRKIAYQTSLAKPDFVFLTGDLVYGHGQASEYAKNFFPVYNAESATPESGAPLLRSTLFAASVGNHDTEYRDFAKYPDALAYFDYWSVPADGPSLKSGDTGTPKLIGTDEAQKAFLTAASDYPRAANYSFDYGSAHWTILDSNPYVDWSDPSLRAWLEKDLKGAKKATWRFVAFHHPPFNSSTKHQDDQQMRVLCDLFEKYGVDVVWAGHVHNYQRTYPMKFAAVKRADGKYRDAKGRVEGKWTLDTAYDGTTKTKPSGVLYVISGGGGGDLYDPDIQQKPTDWKPFTARYIADAHSFTEADVHGTTLSVRQVSDDGKELDKWTVTK